MLFDNIKWVVYLCRFLGLFSVRIIDSNEIIYKFFSFNNLGSFFVLTSNFFMFVFLISVYPISVACTQLIVIISAIVCKLSELINMNDFVDFMKMVNNFENQAKTLLIQRDKNKRKYLWLILIISSIIYHTYVVIDLYSDHLTIFKAFHILTYLYATLGLKIVSLLYVILLTELKENFYWFKDIARHVLSSKSNNNVKYNLEDVRKLYIILTTTADKLINFYDVQVTAAILFLMFHAFYYVYQVIALGYDTQWRRISLYPYIIYTVHSVATVTENLKISNQSIVRAIRKLSLVHLSRDDQLQVELLLLQIKQHTMYATSNMYLPLNRKMLPNLTTSFVSYFVLMMQLAPHIRKKIDT